MKARSEKVGRNEALIRYKKVAMSLPAISRLLSPPAFPTQVMRRQYSARRNCKRVQNLTKMLTVHCQNLKNNFCHRAVWQIVRFVWREMKASWEPLPEKKVGGDGGGGR